MFENVGQEVVSMTGLVDIVEGFGEAIYEDAGIGGFDRYLGVVSHSTGAHGEIDITG
jgi:hypothetical protein